MSKEKKTIESALDLNIKLLEKLAKKEEEIEQLRESQSITFKTLKETDAELEKYQKESVKLRHEICEEIRKYLKYNNGQEYILMLDETISLNEVLDKIEKGEE